MGSIINIDNPSNYKRTHKKKYQIWASMPPEGTQVSNFLEKSNYVTSQKKQFVLTGTVGEKWVVDVEKLCKTYTTADGKPITKELLSSMIVKGYARNSDKAIPIIKPFKIEALPGNINWAMFVPRQYVFQIPTAWGDILTVNDPSVPHGAGDFIVCADAGGEPNLGDRWVVNGAIFADTYDMRAFPNMANNMVKSHKVEIKHPEFNGISFEKPNIQKHVNSKQPVQSSRSSHDNRIDYVNSFKKNVQAAFNVVNKKIGNKLCNPCYIDDPCELRAGDEWACAFEFSVDPPSDEDADLNLAVIAVTRRSFCKNIELTVIIDGDPIINGMDLPNTTDGIKMAYAEIVRKCM